jgi:hypothetical protein
MNLEKKKSAKFSPQLERLIDQEKEEKQYKKAAQGHTLTSADLTEEQKRDQKMVRNNRIQSLTS